MLTYCIFVFCGNTIETYFPFKNSILFTSIVSSIFVFGDIMHDTFQSEQNHESGSSRLVLFI